MKIALAFSGGLDTSFCVPYLRETHGADVVTVTVNTGGVTPDELAEVAARSRALGAVEHHEIDARRAVYDRFVSYLIRGNVLRGEVYPLSVAAERTAQAVEVAKVAQAIGADAVAHGSTGAGNDQVRFDVALRALLPGVPLLTPVRELGMAREEALAFLKEHGLEIPQGADRYSVNRGLWGTTIGGGWTHDSWEAPPADAWSGLAGSKVASEPRDLVIGWREGLPVSLDDSELEGIELVDRLGSICAEYHVGRGIHIGQTALGIVGRIGFEAGAALALIQAHRELEKITLTRTQSFWKDHLARVYGDQLHEGRFFDPGMRDIEAMIVSSQRTVDGDTRLHFEAGHVAVTGVASEHSSMKSELALYGETQTLWTGAEAAAFSKIAAVPALVRGAKEARAAAGWDSTKNLVAGKTQ